MLMKSNRKETSEAMKSKVIVTHRASGKTLQISSAAFKQLLHHLQVTFNKEIQSLCVAHHQQLVKSIH